MAKDDVDRVRMAGRVLPAPPDLVRSGAFGNAATGLGRGYAKDLRQSVIKWAQHHVP